MKPTCTIPGNLFNFADIFEALTAKGVLNNLIHMNTNWLFLIIGGLFETGFAMSLAKMQHTEGKQMWLWFFSFVACVALSMYLLYKAMGDPHPIPAGTAYAVWAGIGAIGAVVLGILFFREPVTFWRIFFLSTLIISIVGLQLTTQNTVH